MAFHEVQFPSGISFGSQGGPGFRTVILENDAGQEVRISRWSGARRQYNVAENIKSWDDLYEIYEFYMARNGAAHGFRFKDWLDFTSADDGRTTPANDDQTIGTGNGSQTLFQLKKIYTNGENSLVRNITKPVVGTVVVSVNSVSKTEGVDYTVDTTTGIVTLAVAPTNGHLVKVGFEFDVPVRFGEDADSLMNLSLDDYGSGSASIPVVEIIDETAIPDEFYYGGGAELSFAVNTQLSLALGRALKCTATVASKNLILPNPSGWPSGGPYWFIYNAGTEAFGIIQWDNTVVDASVAAGESVTILLGSSDDWFAI